MGRSLRDSTASHPKQPLSNNERAATQKAQSTVDYIMGVASGLCSLINACYVQNRRV